MKTINEIFGAELVNEVTNKVKNDLKKIVADYNKQVSDKRKDHFKVDDYDIYLLNRRKVTCGNVEVNFKMTVNDFDCYLEYYRGKLKLIQYHCLDESKFRQVVSEFTQAGKLGNYNVELLFAGDKKYYRFTETFFDGWVRENDIYKLHEVKVFDWHDEDNMVHYHKEYVMIGVCNIYADGTISDNAPRD